MVEATNILRSEKEHKVVYVVIMKYVQNKINFSRIILFAHYTS